jgi:phenylpropionate dioxygenase-like ring-hydroxylating dioxygenase large terminal subunit
MTDEFLHKVWYMAGWSEELTGGRIARRILDLPVLVFRGANGEAVALEDRCPHRFAPLSRGEITDGIVTCPYHGLRFDATGACVGNPYADRIPKGAQVKKFVIEERDTILWLWAGELERADPSLIPDFKFLEPTSHSRTVYGHTLMQAPYQYGTDNLLDLSHIEFIHRGTFGGLGVIFAGEHEVREDGDTLHSDWWMPDVQSPPMARARFGAGGRVDHWLDMRWNAPATMFLEVGATATGAPREAGIRVPQAHIVTPATAKTSHYFWAVSRRNDIHSAEVDAKTRMQFTKAFDEEDKPIIEAAYANMDGVAFWDRKPIFLGVDAAGARARRIIERMHREENTLQGRAIPVIHEPS